MCLPFLVYYILIPQGISIWGRGREAKFIPKPWRVYFVTFINYPLWGLRVEPPGETEPDRQPVLRTPSPNFLFFL